MHLRALLPPVTLLALACQTVPPQRVSNANLGVAATFPGPAVLSKHVEPSPFGDIEWHDLTCAPAGRLDESFHIEVGNLPQGRQGGTTPPEILATFEGVLTYRLGALQKTPLPAGQGPGFHYLARHPQGHTLEGVVVLRRGRLHHAQATTRQANDKRLRAFIDGFEVAP